MRDRGTGITFDEIRYLQRIGGSSKNERKRRDVAEMPEWMWPSGIFGIGLQSVFMFTNEVRLTTRHHESHETYTIVLRNADEPGTDGLLIKALDGDAAKRFRVGTRVDFDIEDEKVPLYWRISGEHEEAMQALRDFDFLAHDELPIQALKLRHAARKFAAACLATVRTSPVTSKPGDGISKGKPSWGPFFDRPTGILIRELQADLFADDVVLSYRGAPVAKPELRARRLIISCDAYFGKAKDVLQLSREAPTRWGAERPPEETGRGGGTRPSQVSGQPAERASQISQRNTPERTRCRLLGSLHSRARLDIYDRERMEGNSDSWR